MADSPSTPAPREFAPVEEQMARLERGAVDLVDRATLTKRLEVSRCSGRPLLIKTGFDPTSPDLHLGHTVLLRKMRHFQDCGHKVVFLVGDFTAMIGDPTGKKTTRPQLSQEEVRENALTYQEQAWKVLDREQTIIMFNSEWLSPLGSEGLIRLAGSYTLARMMERDDFRTRYEEHQPISIHELLYPLVQGYDSVAMEADVELGGHDQIFNLLVGRDLMRERQLAPQVVLTVPLLVGTDGTDKMSKSLGNAIGVLDSPREMYGRTMSIPDTLMWDWYLLLTDTEESAIQAMRQAVDEGKQHPKEVKQRLARSIVEDFHDQGAALGAEREFESVFAGGGVPEDTETRKVEELPVLQAFLAEAGMAKSKGEARRLIQQGAVSLDGDKITDPFAAVPARLEPYLLKVGKRRFLYVQVG